MQAIIYVVSCYRESGRDGDGVRGRYVILWVRDV